MQRSGGRQHIKPPTRGLVFDGVCPHLPLAHLYSFLVEFTDMTQPSWKSAISPPGNTSSTNWRA